MEKADSTMTDDLAFTDGDLRRVDSMLKDVTMPRPPPKRPQPKPALLDGLVGFQWADTIDEGMMNDLAPKLREALKQADERVNALPKKSV